MKPVLFVKNDRAETFGIAPKVFADEGVDVIVVDAPDPSASWPALDEVSGVVMFGGSMNVDETQGFPFLDTDRALTRDAVDRGVPYLGICLGAQILARAMDRPVPKSPSPELGFEIVRPLPAASQDPLLGAFTDPVRMFQWHEDTVELPEGAELLATGDEIEVQAYRVREFAWGVQFHFEVDAAEICLWLDDYGEGLDRRWGKSPDDVRAEARTYIREHEAVGADLLRRFVSVTRHVNGGR